MFSESEVNSIVSHMNEDHADAVALYLQAFAGVDGASDITLSAIDASGMDISYRLDNQPQIARVAFDPPLAEADEVRSRLVTMVNQARKQLSD